LDKLFKNYKVVIKANNIDLPNKENISISIEIIDNKFLINIITYKSNYILQTVFSINIIIKHRRILK
jgi:hypothetical protein